MIVTKRPKTRGKSPYRKYRPVLRFTPYAWSKLLFLRDLGDTEVGGFGISSITDLLLVEDVRLVTQRCTSVTVRFEDEAVADFFDEQVDLRLKPEQFGRIWLHTHPGNCPRPSCTDEETFERCFGSSDWAVMGIVACGGDAYARLRFRAGPGGQLVVLVEVDYRQPFEGSDQRVWRDEYERCVFPEVQRPWPYTGPGDLEFDQRWSELDFGFERAGGLPLGAYDLMWDGG
jgi:hypothetical protein